MAANELGGVGHAHVHRPDLVGRVLAEGLCWRAPAARAPRRGGRRVVVWIFERGEVAVAVRAQDRAECRVVLRHVGRVAPREAAELAELHRFAAEAAPHVARVDERARVVERLRSW